MTGEETLATNEQPVHYEDCACPQPAKAIVEEVTTLSPGNGPVVFEEECDCACPAGQQVELQAGVPALVGSTAAPAINIEVVMPQA